MARAQGARAQMALAFETTYGTPPASGYTRMPFASATLGAEQPLLNSELLGYGRDPLPPIKDAVTSDGDVVVPIDAQAFGFWLKAAFGNPTTTGAEAPYTHLFQSGAWALPSMSIGAPTVATAITLKVEQNIGRLKALQHPQLCRPQMGWTKDRCAMPEPPCANIRIQQGKQHEKAFSLKASKHGIGVPLGLRGIRKGHQRLRMQ